LGDRVALGEGVCYNSLGHSAYIVSLKRLSQSVNLPEQSIDTLAQELAAIQQTSSKRVAILGSRHVPITHQKLIEMMSYALVLGGNRLTTSGATGTNSAAIRGAMRADANLLTVILPQSLDRQPRESREQLEQVVHLVENPDRDHLSLGEASALCNREIVSRCQQLICFAFHDSSTLLKTCEEAEELGKLVTLFYFD
jgi:predicted Rossmann fold nucleotide-binding protein DprA/Smf involved in DNA uptake